MGIFTAIQTVIAHGGAAAWFILASGVILAVLTYDRITTLYFKLSIQAQDALTKVRQAVLRRDYNSAIQVCNSNLSSPELTVLKSGLLAIEHGREAIRSALGGAVLDVTRKCERRVPLIALIAGVSTLLGLLGTISGLIKTFEAIASADASTKGELLGRGISEAMYATATGLTIGVIAMIIHTLCTSKTDDIVGNAQNAGYQLITWIEESERGQSNG